MQLHYYARNAEAAHRSRARIMRSGFTPKGDRLWEEWEEEILRKHFPNYKRMERSLKHRTGCAIRSHCRKLGLKRAIHNWSAAEISKLRRLYPTAPIEDICAAFPHSTYINIRQVAQYHGFRRKRVPYSSTGFPALDEVRNRCFEARISMPELDKIARTKTYFQKMGWRGKPRPNYRFLGLAMEALNGVLAVTWMD